MRITEAIGFWGMIILSAALVALLLADCTCRISGADLRVIKAWQSQWPTPDSMSTEDPFDTTEARQ